MGGRRPGDPGTAAPNPYAILWVTSFGLLMMLVSTTSVNVAVPELSAEFGARAAVADWFLLAFMLANTASILVFGRVSDLFGRRRVYLFGLVAFMVVSVLATLSPNAGFFIAMRFLQGVAAATMAANTMAIVADAFPPAQLAQALSYNFTAGALGNTIGPAVGGVLVSTFGWQSIFLVNVPFGLVALALGIRFLPGRPERHPGAERRGLDIVGAVLSAVGLSAAVFALNRVSSHGLADRTFLLAGVTGIVLLVGFVGHVSRADDPLLDLTIVRDRRRAAAYGAGFFSAFARSGSIVLVVLHQQILGGRSAAEAGLIVTILAAAMTVATPLAGRLTLILTWRAVSVIGGLCLVAGLVGLAVSPTHGSVVATTVWLVLVGVGIGMFNGPNSAATMVGVPAEHRTSANAVRAMLFNVAQAVSTSICLLVIASSGLPSYDVRDSSPPVVRAFTLGYTVCLVAAVLALALAFGRRGPWLQRARLAQLTSAPVPVVPAAAADPL